MSLKNQPRQQTAAPSPANGSAAQCALLQAELNKSIPLTRAMQLEVCGWSDQGLTLTAPLAPNVNDKGSAFGGSLSALLTVAGWGLLWLRTKQAQLTCDLVIYRGEIRYLQPVTGLIMVSCPQPDDSKWQLFSDQFTSRGKARIRLRPVVLDSAGREAVTFQTEFVALKRS